MCCVCCLRRKVCSRKASSARTRTACGPQRTPRCSGFKPNRIDICHLQFLNWVSVFCCPSVCVACIFAGHTTMRRATSDRHIAHTPRVRKKKENKQIKKQGKLHWKESRDPAAGLFFFWFRLWFFLLRCANLIASHRSTKTKATAAARTTKTSVASRRVASSKRMQRRLRPFKLIKLSIRPVRAHSRTQTVTAAASGEQAGCGCVCESVCLYKTSSESR